jgi:hypothetical protein
MSNSGLDRSSPKRADGITALMPALGLATLTLIAGLGTVYAPPPTGEMGVMFAPWVSQPQAFAAVLAAGGRFVGGSRLPNVIVAYALDAGFGERVRAQGAWMTVAAKGLCGAIDQPDGGTT